MDNELLNEQFIKFVGMLNQSGIKRLSNDDTILAPQSTPNELVFRKKRLGLINTIYSLITDNNQTMMNSLASMLADDSRIIYDAAIEDTRAYRASNIRLGASRANNPLTYPKMDQVMDDIKQRYDNLSKYVREQMKDRITKIRAAVEQAIRAGSVRNDSITHLSGVSKVFFDKIVNRQSEKKVLILGDKNGPSIGCYDRTFEQQINSLFETYRDRSFKFYIKSDKVGPLQAIPVDEYQNNERFTYGYKASQCYNNDDQSRDIQNFEFGEPYNIDNGRLITSINPVTGKLCRTNVEYFNLNRSDLMSYKEGFNDNGRKSNFISFVRDIPTLRRVKNRDILLDIAGEIYEKEGSFDRAIEFILNIIDIDSNDVDNVVIYGDIPTYHNYKDYFIGAYRLQDYLEFGNERNSNHKTCVRLQSNERETEDLLDLFE